MEDGAQDLTLGESSGAPATALRRALHVLADPWSMLILKEAFNGVRRFSAFQAALNIPRQTLSLRLAHLCRAQLLYRRRVAAGQATLEYAMTAKARDLSDVMYAVWLWHAANPGEVDVLPFDIVHVACGQSIAGASYLCAACGEPATSANVTVAPADPPQFDTGPRPRLARRNDGAFTAAEPDGRGMLMAASLVGDLPCNEILYLLFRGPGHLRGLARELGLGLPVVRSRLDKLCALGLVEEVPEGARKLYRVRPRAEGFFPLLLSIAAWGDRWCNDGEPPPETLTHSCGALMRGRYACPHCGGAIAPGKVRVVPRH